MKEKVSFQLSFKEGGKAVEVMNVDYDHWKGLQNAVREKYLTQGILTYMAEDLPVSLSREEFLATEGEMRKIDEKELSSNAYIALFSLDIFLRQLEDLAEADIRFEMTA